MIKQPIKYKVDEKSEISIKAIQFLDRISLHLYKMIIIRNVIQNSALHPLNLLFHFHRNIFRKAESFQCILQLISIPNVDIISDTVKLMRVGYYFLYLFFISLT